MIFGTPAEPRQPVRTLRGTVRAANQISLTKSNCWRNCLSAAAPCSTGARPAKFPAYVWAGVVSCFTGHQSRPRYYGTSAAGSRKTISGAISLLAAALPFPAMFWSRHWPATRKGRPQSLHTACTNPGQTLGLHTSCTFTLRCTDFAQTFLPIVAHRNTNGFDCIGYYVLFYGQWMHYKHPLWQQ